MKQILKLIPDNFHSEICNELNDDIYNDFELNGTFCIRDEEDLNNLINGDKERLINGMQILYYLKEGNKDEVIEELMDVCVEDELSYSHASEEEKDLYNRTEQFLQEFYDFIQNIIDQYDVEYNVYVYVDGMIDSYDYVFIDAIRKVSEFLKETDFINRNEAEQMELIERIKKGTLTEADELTLMFSPGEPRSKAEAAMMCLLAGEVEDLMEVDECFENYRFQLFNSMTYEYSKDFLNNNNVLEERYDYFKKQGRL